MKPKIMGMGMFEMAVCVPGLFTDEQVEEFANREQPCGTSYGWKVRKGDSEEGGDERVQCHDHPDNSHIILVLKHHTQKQPPTRNQWNGKKGRA